MSAVKQTRKVAKDDVLVNREQAQSLGKGVRLDHGSVGNVYLNVFGHDNGERTYLGLSFYAKDSTGEKSNLLAFTSHIDDPESLSEITERDGSKPDQTLVRNVKNSIIEHQGVYQRFIAHIRKNHPEYAQTESLLDRFGE